MDMLIHTLKKQHGEILALFTDIKVGTINTEDGQKKLAKSKELLLAHLKLEDEKLYPALIEAAKQDNQLKSLVQGYITEMNEISVVALDFFKKYSGQKMQGMEFAKDYGKFIAALQQRIRREESVLYTEYDKRFK